MDAYDLENQDLSEEEIKELESEDANKKILKAGAKGAANYYIPGSGKIVDMAANTRVGDKILSDGSKVATHVLNQNFATKRLQDNLNRLNQSGIVDMADSAADLVGGDAASAGTEVTSKATEMAESVNEVSEMADNIIKLDPKSRTTKQDFHSEVKNYERKDVRQEIHYESISTDDIEADYLEENKVVKVAKRALIFQLIFSIPGLAIMSFLFFSFLLFVVIVSMLPSFQLNLTSEYDGYTATSENTIPNTYFEENMLYIGDERTEYLSKVLVNSSIKYLHEQELRHDTLNNIFNDSFKELIDSGEVKYAILNIGLFDTDKSPSYITYYNDLIKEYPNVDFYFLSVNPVDENKSFEHGIILENKNIEKFNKEIKKEFKDNYIDTFNYVKDHLLTEEDGIIYIESVYKDIHERVIEFLRSKNIVDYSGKVKPTYNDLNFPEIAVPLPFYKQTDKRWKDEPLANSTIGKAGCGPTSLTMVINGLHNESLNVTEVAAFAESEGLIADNGASYWDLMRVAGENYKLKVEQIKRQDSATVKKILQNRIPIITIMGKGTFTSNGHFIVLVGINENDEVYVLDPNSHERTKKQWPLSTIMNESSKKQGDNAVTFWAYTK